MGDVLEEKLFTGHSSLAKIKTGFEHQHNGLNTIRKWFGLGPLDTNKSLKERNTALVIPMKKGTFKRPKDWHKNIIETDFIFLRGSGAGKSLGEPCKSFIA